MHYITGRRDGCQKSILKKIIHNQYVSYAQHHPHQKLTWKSLPLSQKQSLLMTKSFNRSRNNSNRSKTLRLCSPYAPKENMRKSKCLLVFHCPTKVSFPSQKMAANRIMRNPKKYHKGKLPKGPSNWTVKQQVIHRLQVPFTDTAPIHQDLSLSLKVVTGQYFSIRCLLNKKRNL